MTSDASAIIQNLVIHSHQYFGNGLVSLRDGEAGKAGELLWGSVALAIQAVATSKSYNVDSHRKLKNFALQLAIDLNDESLKTDFIVAESLHHNFYDIQQEPQDIAPVVPIIERVLSTL